MTDARGRRLRTAFAAVLVRDNAPEVRLVRAWLDSWAHHRRHDAPGQDVQLTAYAARDWRANFFQVGIAHTPSSADSAWERMPWRAVMRAAWETVSVRLVVARQAQTQPPPHPFK